MERVYDRGRLHRAWETVQRNDGAAGIDQMTVKAFGERVEAYLDLIHAKLRAGTYRFKPVRRVEIPKPGSSKKRKLGIPTVSDRVAQAVVKAYLEPLVEPHFHPDSYGYRPGKSAHDAVAATRQRCWRYDWLIDLDIRGFFDHLDHSLTLRAVGKYTQCPWILLYVTRWLKAPVQLEDGTLEPREKGTPQGGVATPRTQLATSSLRR